MYGKDFTNFEMLDAKIASALNKIIQNSHFKKKVSLEEQKAQKEARFLRGRQIALCDLRLFSSTVLDYAVLFSVTLHDYNSQEFDARRDEVLLSVSKIPSDYIRKVCKNWEYVSPRNSKPYWNCTTWRFVRRYRCPIIKSRRTWWRGVKIRNFDSGTLTPGTGELKREQWSGIKREWVALKEEEVPVERKRPVFERRPMQFPA